MFSLTKNNLPVTRNNKRYLTDFEHFWRNPFAFFNDSNYDDTIMPLRMWEADNNLHVEIDLPGVSRDDVTVSVNNNILNVKAKRYESNSTGNNLRQEVYYGTMDRSITLPCTVQAGDCQAELKTGVLRLTFSKSKPDETQKIEVR